MGYLAVGGILSVLVAMILSSALGELVLYLLAAAIPGILVAGVYLLRGALKEQSGQLDDLRKELKELRKEDENP